MIGISEGVSTGVPAPSVTAQFEARGIEVVGDVLREEALAVFRDYRKSVDTADGIVVYNARGGAE